MCVRTISEFSGSVLAGRAVIHRPTSQSVREDVAHPRGIKQVRSSTMLGGWIFMHMSCVASADASSFRETWWTRWCRFLLSGSDNYKQC